MSCSSSWSPYINQGRLGKVWLRLWIHVVMDLLGKLTPCLPQSYLKPLSLLAWGEGLHSVLEVQSLSIVRSVLSFPLAMQCICGSSLGLGSHTQTERKEGM